LSQKLEKPRNLKIYDYDYQLEHVYNLIRHELSPENVRLVEQYDVALVNSALAKATRHKNLKMILSLSRLLNKNWIDVSKEDIDELVFKIMKKYSDDSGKETNTTWDHKKVLKIFFRWVRLGSRDKNEVGDPHETKGVKIKRVKDKIIREDLLTEDDLTRLLHACGENTRDRAFIDCHFEAGTRPGEILNLQIRHAKFDDNGAVLHVDGKTGPRTVRLIKSVPNLALWLENHPFRDDPEAPLWVNMGERNFGEVLNHAAATRMIKRRCKKAKLSKRVYPNLFRHSEATRMANFLTEAQLRKRHGWTPDSKMPARYVHLINADVEDAIFKHYGIKKREEEKQQLPQICNICKTQNPPQGSICSKCGKPLDLKTALELEEKDKQELNDVKNLLEEMSKKIDELWTDKQRMENSPNH